MFRARYLEGKLHLLEYLPTPLTVNRTAHVFTEPVSHLTPIPESTRRGVLLEGLVQQRLLLIVEDDLTMALIMLPLVTQGLRAFAVVASDYFINPGSAIACYLCDFSGTLALAQ